jgi:hypothetical protein
MLCGRRTRGHYLKCHQQLGEHTMVHGIVVGWLAFAQATRLPADAPSATLPTGTFVYRSLSTGLAKGNSGRTTWTLVVKVGGQCTLRRLSETRKGSATITVLSQPNVEWQVAGDATADCSFLQTGVLEFASRLAYSKGRAVRSPRGPLHVFCGAVSRYGPSCYEPRPCTSGDGHTVSLCGVATRLRVPP